MPTTWWWSRARSKAIGFCHVSACIRHSDHPEFVASWRDFRPSFNQTLSSHVHVPLRPTAIAPCHPARADCETLYPRMCSDMDSTHRDSAPRPSRKHPFCPRRHPLRPGRLFALNSRSLQTSGPTRCLPRPRESCRPQSARIFASSLTLVPAALALRISCASTSITSGFGDLAFSFCTWPRRVAHRYEASYAGSLYVYNPGRWQRVRERCRTRYIRLLLHLIPPPAWLRNSSLLSFAVRKDVPHCEF